MDESTGVSRQPETSWWTGLSRSTIYRLEKLGKFPPRIKIGPRAVGWSRESIRDWLATRERL